jgi:hypothetical protein
MPDLYSFFNPGQHATAIESDPRFCFLPFISSKYANTEAVMTAVLSVSVDAGTVTRTSSL